MEKCWSILSYLPLPGCVDARRSFVCLFVFTSYPLTQSSPRFFWTRNKYRKEIIHGFFNTVRLSKVPYTKTENFFVIDHVLVSYDFAVCHGLVTWVRLQWDGSSVLSQYNRLIAGRRHLTFQTIPQCTSPNMLPPPLPLSFSEETVAKTWKGDPLPSVTLIASYTLSTFRSEERRKKKKMAMRGWKKENCSLQPRSVCVWNKLRENTLRAAPTLLNKPAVSSLCWSAVFNIYLRCLARRPTL